jgi:hypothetical protein
MARDKHWRPPKDVSPEIIEKRRKEQRFREQLELIAEYLDEDSFVQAAKEFDPDPDELREWIMLFRAYVREKRGL